MPNIDRLPCGCNIIVGEERPIGACTRHTIDDFTYVFFSALDKAKAFYFGIPTLKFPTDAWIIQEILCKTQPDVIVETGTAWGGSALMMAHILDRLGKGRIITIECDAKKTYVQHPRITYLSGFSTSEEIFFKVKSLIVENESVMVDLDSAHNMKNVLKEMRMYGPLVTVGKYLIVEDTFISGHPIHFLAQDRNEVSPGPYEAVEIFLKENLNFKPDKMAEKFLLTSNPNGYLVRVK